MRLWHKDLIPVLPRQQLVAQWRELCCIMRSIEKNGTPNHLLVNKVMDYPVMHFVRYSLDVVNEIKNRGYKVSKIKCKWFFEKVAEYSELFCDECFSTEIYEGWHNNRYFKQCYYNLQEKYDCGGISQEEWSKIEVVFQEWEIRTIERLEKSLDIEIKFLETNF